MRTRGSADMRCFLAGKGAFYAGSPGSRPYRAAELHHIDVPNDLYKRLLNARSSRPRERPPRTTDAEFDAITVYFQPPAEDEGFTVVRHARTD